MVTREEAIRQAGEVIAEGRRAAAQMTVEEQARAAYTPTGPSIPELEVRIRARRAATRAMAEACAVGSNKNCDRMTRCSYDHCQHPRRSRSS